MRFGIMLLVGFFVTKLVLPALIKILSEADILKENWRGEPVITIGGIIIPVVLCLVYIPLGIRQTKPEDHLYLIAVCAVSLLGLTDDLLGGSSQKGIRGHFLYLWTQRKVSTGVIKAFGIGLAALWVIVKLQTDYIFLNWLVLVLSANFLNLLDLRPGRAIKGFIIICVPAVIMSLSADNAYGINNDYSLLAVSSGIVLAYARYDFQSVLMLGDTGSNTLGIIAGIALLKTPVFFRAFLVLSLIILHLAAERYSFSKLIEGNSWLNKLDRWGRE